MAVGNPYGRGLYGKGPYARYDTRRPYGVGPYGKGPYARWGGNTFEMGAASGILFGVTARSPELIAHFGAVTGITFDAWSLGLAVVVHPWAITEIMLAPSAGLAWNWAGLAACESGAWAPSGACKPGVWTPLPGCTAGNWTLTEPV